MRMDRSEKGEFRELMNEGQRDMRMLKGEEGETVKMG